MQSINKGLLLATFGLMIGSVVSTVMAEQILCPGKLTFVSIGDDVQTVMNTCGKPQRVINRQTHSHQKPKSIHWYYYGTGNNFVVHNSIVSFYGGKVTNIVSSGASADSMDCVNGSIKAGDTMATVRQKCGYPVATADNKQLAGSEGSFQAVGNIQQREQRYNALNLLPQYGKWKSGGQQKAEEQQDEASRPHKFTVLIYQPQSYLQKTAFMFIDDKLTQTGRVADQ